MRSIPVNVWFLMIRSRPRRVLAADWLMRLGAWLCDPSTVISDRGARVKLRKMAGKIGVTAAMVAAALTVGSGGAVANADTDWGQIQPMSSWESCVALYGPDGFNNNNTRATQWGCNGHNDQQWSVHRYGTSPTGDALYQIINLQSRKCLEVRNANLISGTPVDQFTCGTTGSIDSLSTQLWAAVPTNSGNGAYFVIPWSTERHSGEAQFCLDVAGGTTDDGAMLVQWQCNYYGNEQFDFEDSRGYAQFL
jgi:hypothetical protein